MRTLLHAVRHRDLDEIAPLHARCFPDDPWDAVALAEILAMPRSSGRILADGAGAPVAFLFDLLLAEEAEVLTLGVAPEMRRRGYARLLLDDLFTRARAAGARHIVLEVAIDNAAALALYRAAGFERVGERRGYYRRAGGRNADACLLRLSLGNVGSVHGNLR